MGEEGRKVRRRVRPEVAVGLLVLCLVAFVGAGRAAAHGHMVASIVIAAGASISGLVVLLVQPSGRRR
jgi:Ca2+/H+ antiporter